MNKESIEKFRVDPNDFTINPSKHTINESCRIISFVTQTSTGKKCVLKKTHDSVKKSVSLLLKEAEILSTCHHPAIAPFIGFFIEKDKLNVYFAEIENGSLEENIINNQGSNKNPLWNDTHKMIISYGIASAMSYLHSKNILHHNLKPTNILLDSKLFPYVIDFESANLLENINDQSIVNSRDISYMAPEFFEDYMHCNQSKSIDVYSYSMILYYLWTEQYPYPSDYSVTQIIQETLENKRPHFPSSTILSDQIRSLISECWSQDPSKRPTFSEISDRLSSTEFLTSLHIDSDQFHDYAQSIISNETSPNASKEFERSIENSQYINQLKKLADSGNSEAQNSLALHLYNGYNIEKDVNLASRYFELAAEGGNDEAKLWLSFILIREGRDVEKAVSFLSSVASSPDSRVPEALSLYGQQLLSDGDADESTRVLLSAIQRGSISAMINYARTKKSDADFYFKMAANCCHCLDTAGFFFPVDHRVFRCDDCSIEVCEACAMSCHKNHKTIEIGTNHNFVCDCGRSHFNGRCSAQYVGEMKYKGEPQIYQHFFSCLDCFSPQNLQKICRACAEKCHKGHRIVDCGVVKGMCQCGFGGCCKLLNFVRCEDNECSRVRFEDGLVNQRWFVCVTCGLVSEDVDGVCESCAEKCHAGHVVIDRGVRCATCKCCNTKKCKFIK